MTKIEIEDLFKEAISKRGIHKELEVTSDIVYNWRNRESRKPNFGTMVDVLYKLGLIKIEKS